MHAVRTVHVLISGTSIPVHVTDPTLVLPVKTVSTVEPILYSHSVGWTPYLRQVFIAKIQCKILQQMLSLHLCY